MSQRILVTGATGHIGSELVRALQQRKADFAVMTSPSGRSVPGVLSVEGDFAGPASLERAFRGFDVVFLLLPLMPNKVELARNAVRAAKAAGVRHIVRSSSAGADAASPVAIAKLQGTIDELVQASGLQWTLLRPSFFMQNWVNYNAGQYIDVPESAARDAMLGMGMPEVVVEWYMSLNHVVKQGWAGGLTDDVKTLTGHAPRRFVDFVRENAPAFR